MITHHDPAKTNTRISSPTLARGVKLAAFAFALALALGSCTGGETIDSTTSSPTTETTSGPGVTDDAGIPSPVVQDLWAIDTLTTIDETATTVDLTGAVLAAVRNDLGEPTDLWDGITFREAPSLDALLIDDTGNVRDDVDVVAGIAATPAGEVLIVIATPRPTADPVASTDRLQLDLTFLEGQVDIGDPLFADYVFIQSFAPTNAAGESTTDGVAMFAARVADGRFSVLAGPDESGELTPVVARGQLGEFVEGSILAVVPPKIAAGFGAGVVVGGAICVIFKGPACAAIPILGAGGAVAGAALTLNNNGADPAPPPPPAGNGRGRSTGEPHLVTFDGIAYDSQLVGEFVLARTGDLEIQTRQSPYGTSRLIAYNTAVAVGIADHRVTYNVESEEPLRIDGDVVALEPGATVNHDGIQVDAYDSAIEVVTGAGDIVQIQVGPGVNVIVVPADGNRTWEGLLGSPNGSVTDDLTTRNGVELEESAESGYSVAESWRITDAESLFDYSAGENTATYTDLSYPDVQTTLADLDTSARARATAVCRTAGVTEPLLDECIFDYGITGDVVWAAAAQRLSASLANAFTDAQVGRTLLTPLPAYRVDRASRGVVDTNGRIVFPARIPGTDGAVLVALDPATGEVTEWPNINYVCGPGVDAEGRIWVQRPLATGLESMVVIDGATGEEIAVYVPAGTDEQIASCQKSIVRSGDNMVILHEAAFEVTVESFGIDGDVIESRWRQSFPDATLADLTVDPAGTVYVLTRNPSGDSAEIVLSRVDAQSGDVVAEVSLAGEMFEEGSSSVVADGDGRIYVVTTEEVDSRAGYVIAVSLQGDTFNIDWQVDIAGTATEGIRQTPRSLNIVGDNLVGWYAALPEVVAIDRATGGLAWEFNPAGSSGGIDLIPGDPMGNAYLTQADAYLVVIDAAGAESRMMSATPGAPPIATFGPMIDGKLFALSPGADNIPIWSIIDVAP